MHYFDKCTTHFLIRLAIGTFFYKNVIFFLNYNTHSFLHFPEEKERYGAFIHQVFDLENI